MNEQKKFVCNMGINDYNHGQMDVKFIGIFKEKNDAEEAYDKFLLNYIQSLVDEGNDIDDIDENYEFEMYIFEC